MRGTKATTQASAIAAARRRRRFPKGIALVWSAIMLIVMIGLVGLSIDMGKLYWNVHQLQNAADAAALAGAHWITQSQTTARDEAILVAAENSAENRPVTLDRNEDNDPAGELVIGRWNRHTRTFTATPLNPNAVKVVARRAGQRGDSPMLSLLFGPVFGTTNAPASRPAIAVNYGGLGAGILCLSPNPSKYVPYGWPSSNGGSGLLRGGGGGGAIDLRNPDGTVGSIHINSIANDALSIKGIAGKIYAEEITVCGTTDPAPTHQHWDAVQGDPDEPWTLTPYSDHVDDPLAYLNENPPDIATMATYTCPTLGVGASATIQPGWYPNGINPGHGTITMAPGIYAVGGGADGSTGLVNQTGTLIGTAGVMVYVTGGTGTGVEYGRIYLQAKSITRLVSRGDAKDPKEVDGEMGVALWQDENNHNMAEVSGTANSYVIGTIYLPDAPAQLGGTPSEVGVQILAGALHVHGTATVHAPYDGRNFVHSSRSVLVE